MRSVPEGVATGSQQPNLRSQDETRSLPLPVLPSFCTSTHGRKDSDLNQFMSDSATTALFAPIGVALAQVLGRAPEPFVVTVAMASVVAFLTPIGHHGDLLIYGPGRYQFADFVKVGTPLTVICALVVVLLAPWIWQG